MLNRPLTGWAYNDATMKNLAIFASLIDELTFNYTTDSFKAPALNVISLIEEAHMVLEDVERGIIKEGAFLPIIEELKYSMSKANVFKKLLKKKNLIYLLEELNDTSNRTRLSNALNLLVSYDLNIEYCNCIKEKIIDLIIRNDKNREYLVQLTRVFITQLHNVGYSDDFIYRTNLDYFYGKNNIVNNADNINGFLDKFNCIRRDYNVYFVGSCEFTLLKQSFYLKGINISNNFGLTYNDKSTKKFLKQLRGDSVCISLRIRATDSFSARRQAMLKIQETTRFYAFFYHKKHLELKTLCFVENFENKEHYCVSPPIPNIVKCKDMRNMRAAQKLNEVLGSIFFSKESYQRIVNSLELHASSLQTTNLENQFVNLYTALEVLIPKKTNVGRDRIQQIHDILIPYLSIPYYYKLLKSTLDSLFVWNRSFVENILIRVKEGTTNVHKFSALVVLEKYDSKLNDNKELDQLKKELFNDHYFLMLNRIDFLKKILHSHKSISEFMNSHKQRLKWHIDRIYRTRNLIVHVGSSPSYMGTLIENIHSYYDTLVEQLFHDNILNHFYDIELSYNNSSIKSRAYNEYLELNKNEKIDENNIIRAIFFE